MSRSKSARLRMSLFASSSLVGTSLLAGVGGLAVTMAPGAALAACTPVTTGPVAPATTTTTVYTCTGTDPAVAITTLPTDTALTVNFAGEVVTTGGTSVADTGAAQAAAINFNSASGANSTTNAAGAGLTLDATNKGGPITMTSAVPLTIVGTTGGLVSKNNTGATTITQTGPVTASAGQGVNLTSTTGAITYTGSGATSGTTAGILATSTTGAVSVTQSGTVAASAGPGVSLNSSTGGLTYAGSNSVSGTTAGILANSTSGNVAVTQTGATTATAGPAVSLTTGGAGTIAFTGGAGATSGTTGGIVTSNATGATNVIVNANVAATTGSAVSMTSTTGNMTLTANAGTLTGAATTVNPIIRTATQTAAQPVDAKNNIIGGITQINLGATAAPATSLTNPTSSVVVGVNPVLANSGTTTGVAIGSSGSGPVTVNIGTALFGNSASGVAKSVSQVTSTATVNGHVDFSGQTGNTAITLVGTALSTGTFQSTWNLGTGTSNFGTGNDTIENRGQINVGVAGATASTVVMNFNAPTADTKSLPNQTGGATTDRIWNRNAQGPSASQNLYTPGSINIVGGLSGAKIDPNYTNGTSLTVTGLEVFVNEGAAYLNIRNNSNLSDFVGSNGSTTVASSQAFAMNPPNPNNALGGSNVNTAAYYARGANGQAGDAKYSQFVLTSGTLPGLPTATGVPAPTRPYGGVNLADGDTLDIFATSGELNGNASYTPSPIVGARFLVDFDLSTGKADQLWVGNITGNVTVLPRLTGLASGTAAAYNPVGIRFATEVSNPVVDPSISVDYNALMNSLDNTITPINGTGGGDQGLYRAFVVYRQGTGLTSIGAGNNVYTSGGNPTGGFYLVFLPDTEVYQIANTGRAVQDAVRDSQGNYFSRQADLRDAVGDQVGGAWLKISGNRVKFQNEKTYPFMPIAPAQTRTLWDTYTQTTVDITAGVDGSAPVGPGKLIAGAAVGYTDSDVRFRPSGLGGVSFGQVTQPLDFIPIYTENRTQMEGYHVGGYASYVQDQWFVDASASYTSLDLHSIFSSLNNAVFSTNTKTWSVQALTGYRFVTDDVLSVEPLLGVQYMRTKQDDLNLSANVGLSTFQFNTVESLRPGVGGRVKVATATDLYKLNLGLSAMWWKDQKTNGNKVNVTSGGSTFYVVDNGGTKDTGEIGVNANLIFANGLSAFINSTARGDSDALIDIGFSAGAKYRW